ncbi:hypothetical protein INS49_007201 [Diaporthe citri]|uniref:uncharacterized protein n=1 Tax=Diaporthe citri TaxID=83186 RepID=UPI001C7FAE10|nr:uncharacterized protein INS49_007201 [Diaporthe citri]KAG6365590.1 hypothetical protein INS49_007201 [Diaporthe citri]
MPLGGKGPSVLACLWAQTAVTLTCIVLRWYTRRFIKGKVGADDYVLWVTWIFQVAFAVTFTVSCSYGFGQHNADLGAYEKSMATFWELVGQLAVSITMGTSKAAGALFLLRILTATWQKMILWAWMISNGFLALMLGISVFAQCTPTQALWDHTVAIQSCPISLTNVAYVTCSWSAAMDFFLAVFPWFVLWELNMKRREKITVCLSLSLGIFAGICGVIRTTGLGVLANSADYLYATADSVMYTSSELMVTVICISVPTLRPLWQKALKMQSSAYKYGTGDQFDGSRYGRGTSKKQTLRSFDDGPDGASFGMETLGTTNGTKAKGMMNVTTKVTAFSPTPSGAENTDHSSDNDSDKDI